MTVQEVMRIPGREWSLLEKEAPELYWELRSIYHEYRLKRACAKVIDSQFPSKVVPIYDDKGNFIRFKIRTEEQRQSIQNKRIESFLTERVMR